MFFMKIRPLIGLRIRNGHRLHLNQPLESQAQFKLQSKMSSKTPEPNPDNSAD